MLNSEKQNKIRVNNPFTQLVVYQNFVFLAISFEPEVLEC